MDISELVHLDQMNDHSSVKKYPCNWPGCQKSFGRPSDTARHYKIHTNDRPYKCTEPQCGKRFIQRSALRVHLRTHSGEKPHVCEVQTCLKSFSDSSSLARHRRLHTNNRPYKCDGCNRSFTKKIILIRHSHTCNNDTLQQQQQQEEDWYASTYSKAVLNDNIHDQIPSPPSSQNGDRLIYTSPNMTRDDHFTFYESPPTTCMF